MLKFIEQKLSEFRSCFSRTATYNWFIIIVTGLIVRFDSLGVTSFIRALSLNRRFYESLLHFFRSNAFNTKTLKACWHRIIFRCAPFVRLNGRVLILGDGTKVSKESRHMPGVKKLCQESEDSSKPQFIHGHMFGGIGTVIGNEFNSFCLPLDLNIQDGLSETASWDKGNLSDSATHVIQMIRNAHEISQTFGEDSYCVLDRYFLTVPALSELSVLNSESEHRIDLITRAKNNCIAYEEPELDPNPHRGRPRKKGAAVKLKLLFTNQAEKFKKATVLMYGKEQEVEYLSLNLLWGSKLYQKLQFVLVKYNGGTAIFVCTDLTLNPILVIEAYAHRFKIECMFREIKQQIHGFHYHFWSAHVPKLNKYKKKYDPDPLSTVKEEHRESILLTIDAIERFVLCSEIAMGIIQLIALNPVFVKTIEKHRYLRTSQKGKVSEATVIDYLRKHFFRLLSMNCHSYISQLILSMQESDFSEDNVS